MKHRARKRFGQNFLQDKGIIDAILCSIHPKAQDNLLEIGPGLGALTHPLLRISDKLTIVEIDRDLQAYWLQVSEASKKLQLIASDALEVDYSQFGNNLRIIGNLPYNISTPLMLHLLQFGALIEDMHFMLQKEVVNRLVASPGTKAYGRLTVMIQYHCETESLFDVPPEAFQPAPKVESAFIRLTPYKTSPFEKVSVDQLEQLVASAFAMRRKTLANNLKGIISAERLVNLGINPTDRPEQITIPEYIRITQWVLEHPLS